MSQADERAKVLDGVEPLSPMTAPSSKGCGGRTRRCARRAPTASARPLAVRPRRRAACPRLVLVRLSLVAVWTHNEVSDTDQFVETVGPLVADPSVQQALTNRVTTTVFQYVDVQGLANEAIDALAAQGLRPELAQRMHGLTPDARLCGQRVGSGQGRPGGQPAVRIGVGPGRPGGPPGHGHRAVGRQSGHCGQGRHGVPGPRSVHRRGEAAVERGGTDDRRPRPGGAPDDRARPADQLVRAQTAYSMLDSLATVLPWITVLLLAVGVYLARNRMRALVGTGLGVAAALLVLAVGLLVARGLLVGAVPPAGAPAAAAGFDIVVRFLRDSGRVLLVLALVVALGGFLAGSSDTAVGIRRWFAGMLHKIRGGPSATGPVVTWVRPHMRGLRIGAVALAILVFVFLDRPTGVAILLIATGLLALLAIIEFLGRPGAAPGSS